MPTSVRSGRRLISLERLSGGPASRSSPGTGRRLLLAHLEVGEDVSSHSHFEIVSVSTAELRAGARLWAIYALSLRTGSHSSAKRLELEMTDGAPLAVCVGTGPFWPAVAGFQKTRRVQWR